MTDVTDIEEATEWLKRTIDEILQKGVVAVDSQKQAKYLVNADELESIRHFKSEMYRARHFAAKQLADLKKSHKEYQMHKTANKMIDEVYSILGVFICNCNYITEKLEQFWSTSEAELNND